MTCGKPVEKFVVPLHPILLLLECAAVAAQTYHPAAVSALSSYNKGQPQSQLPESQEQRTPQGAILLWPPPTKKELLWQVRSLSNQWIWRYKLYSKYSKLLALFYVYRFGTYVLSQAKLAKNGKVAR